MINIVHAVLIWLIASCVHFHFALLELGYWLIVLDFQIVFWNSCKSTSLIHINIFCSGSEDSGLSCASWWSTYWYNTSEGSRVVVMVSETATGMVYDYIKRTNQVTGMSLCWPSLSSSFNWNKQRNCCSSSCQFLCHVELLLATKVEVGLVLWWL